MFLSVGCVSHCEQKVSDGQVCREKNVDALLSIPNVRFLDFYAAWILPQDAL